MRPDNEQTDLSRITPVDWDRKVRVKFRGEHGDSKWLMITAGQFEAIRDIIEKEYYA